MCSKMTMGHNDAFCLLNLLEWFWPTLFSPLDIQKLHSQELSKYFLVTHTVFYIKCLPRGVFTDAQDKTARQSLRMKEFVVYTMALPSFTAFGRTSISQTPFLFIEMENSYLRCKVTKAPESATHLHLQGSHGATQSL